MVNEENPKLNTLFIVVPCYNEEAVLQETGSQLSSILDKLIEEERIGNAKIIFVDDGSKDKTWEIIENLSSTTKYAHGLKLSHNEGHQNALLAGLGYSVDKCNAAITIDADLQDDVNAILGMVDSFNEGYEVVYGVRNQRKTDSFFKRNTALLFYHTMMKLGVDIVYNHADYRLMSNRAVKALVSYPERNIFLRGMVKMIGYKSTKIYYDRNKRFAGESKYPLAKMMSFAIDGITSFSVKPLRMIVTMGICFVFFSIIAIIYALCSYLNGTTIHGWTSILISMWFIGGLLLFAIGIVGEYIGKIYTETKRRPRFFIEKEV